MIHEIYKAKKVLLQKLKYLIILQNKEIQVLSQIELIISRHNEIQILKNFTR